MSCGCARIFALYRAFFVINFYDHFLFLLLYHHGKFGMLNLQFRIYRKL